MKSLPAVGVGGLALAALLSVACKVPADGGGAIRADEERFLVYGVLDAYEFWDANGEGSDQWMASTRARLAALRAGAVAGALDPDIVRLYDGAITTVEAYGAFLGQRAGAEASRKRQADQDHLQAFLTGSATALELADQAGRRGNSDGTSGLVGLVGGIGRGMDEAARRATARDAKARAELAAALATFDATVTKILSDATAIVQRLARKNGWQPAEIGLGEGDVPPVDDIVRQRPRDPFSRARLALTRDLSANGRLAAAADFRAAAELVPDRQDYHGVRARFLRDAALYHVAGATLQAPEFSAGPPPAINEALAAVRRYREADPQDSASYGAVLFARALAHSGQFKEALTQALEVRDRFQNDSNFHYLVAQLTTLGGSSEHTAGWIESAYRHGFADVARVRGDPDLSVFRREWPDRYAALTTVDMSFQVLMDVILDDVVLANSSAFGLTNVRAQVMVRQGSKVLRPVVTCATVPKGGSCRLNDIGTLYGGRYDEAGALVTCDQCPAGGAAARHLAPGIAQN